jgi:polyphenol oxidase
MIEQRIDDINFFQSSLLNRNENLVHFFTTRNGGVSKGVFSSLNFGTHHGEEANFPQNLLQVAYAFHLDPDRIVVPKQTHGNRIAIVTQLNYRDTFSDTDGLITNIPGICVAVKTADCVPILIFDKMNRVVAAVHAGWRGTVKNIVGETLLAMKTHFGCNPCGMEVTIGPCIQQHNYEVGPEVVEEFMALLPGEQRIFDFSGCEKSKAKLNVAMANQLLLQKAGILEKNIEISAICTFDQRNHFYSARRDGAKTGRMLNGIFLKNNE